MKTRLNFNLRILALLAVVCAGSLAWAQEYSHVRIVRLSFEEGTVNLQRPNVPGLSEASANTPIQEGFVLSTQEGSFAEVEFENTSTARVGQLSQLVFNQLALDSNGNKLNGMELQQGYATFTVYPENNDVYQVRVGSLTITPDNEKGTRFRVDVDGSNARVEVFKGTVEVSGSFGLERVSKNTSVEYDPNDDAQLHFAHGITKDAWDDWVEKREEEAQLARRKSPPGYYTNQVSSYMYGWNDLYYYGSWSYIPGYGSCWIPTVGAGWLPFSFGQWVWYPGFGYTWVSFEPWGWVPYHYGNWIFEQGYGWAWVPGGFGSWAAAPVSWYQGQTWVAWSPRPLRPRPGGGPLSGQECPGQGCATVVSQTTFSHGLPVQGRRLPGIDVTESDAVAKPSISPADRFRSASDSTPTSGTAGARTPTATGARPYFGAAGESTGGRIVYDPRLGGFVNGRDGDTPAPARVESPAPLRGTSTQTSSGRESLPAQAGLPAPSPTPQRVSPARSSSAPAPEASHHASPRVGVTPPSRDSTFGRALSTWGSGGSSSSSSGSSGRWSAPSSSGGSWSGGSSGSSGGSSPRMSGGGGGGGSTGGGGGGGGHAASTSRGGGTPRQ
ncbi:MAG: DUF6600 domain-containing protein [Deltaproteobacteria bacterium]